MHNNKVIMVVGVILILTLKMVASQVDDNRVGEGEVIEITNVPVLSLVIMLSEYSYRLLWWCGR